MSGISDVEKQQYFKVFSALGPTNGFISGKLNIQLYNLSDKIKL